MFNWQIEVCMRQVTRLERGSFSTATIAHHKQNKRPKLVGTQTQGRLSIFCVIAIHCVWQVDIWSVQYEPF